MIFTVAHLHINGTQGIFEANTRWVAGEEIRFQFIKATGLPSRIVSQQIFRLQDFGPCFDRWLDLQKKAGRESCSTSTTGHRFSVVLCQKFIKNCSKSILACMNSVSRIGPMRTKVTSNPFADLFRGTLELLDYRKLSTANRFFDWLTIQSWSSTRLPPSFAQQPHVNWASVAKPVWTKTHDRNWQAT